MKEPVCVGAVMIMSALSPFPFGGPAAADEPQVRPAYCAGTWYPGDAAALGQEVDALLAAATPPQLAGRPVAIISPHAGYRFSAPVAAAAYASLRGQSYKRVIVLAFSHRHAGRYDGVDVPDALTAYSTPLGQVPLDRDACAALLKSPAFAAHPGVDGGEHSLELQLPFLQKTIGSFALVPLLVGRLSERDCTAAARALAALADDDTLFVVSTDFTHFGPNYGYTPFRTDVAARLTRLAEQAAAPLLRCDYDGFAAHLARTGDTICGRGPLLLLLRTLTLRGGADGVRAAWDTSGRMTGDWTNSVTYQALVFTRRPATLAPAEQAELLRLARQAVTALLTGQPPPEPDPAKLPERLRADGACFVTLKNAEQLRGCIGNLLPEGPLYRAVLHNAVAACRDARFVNNPVTAAELDRLRIEISCLTPMRRITDPDEVIVGRHGLLIGIGPQRGVLLPQVAYERGWSRAEFLAQTCHKAGLPPDAWKRPEAELYVFEAEVFGEP